MREPILETMRSPEQVKRLSLHELTRLCVEVRDFLVDSISRTGGHIGANLGVIELTVALHHVYSFPEDRIIFDTGHQGYTHKLLTGRKELFKTLNQPGGMSRFLARSESPYDSIEASHAGTAISIASGMAQKKVLEKSSENIVAVVGDGALVEGMSAEGLNFVVHGNLPMVIVVNDNGMSIPVNVGGIKNLFSGSDWMEKSRNHFEGLGYTYFCVQDGHDIESLVTTFRRAKDIARDGAVVVHVKTEKGRGLPIAKDHKYKMHFSMPFNPVTGEGSSPVPAGKTYAAVAGDKLCSLMRIDPAIMVITPSTPYASGLDACLEEFPDRTIDVGMAEQHALGYAAGMALSGLKPYVCFQSTFMQRAFDQILHDIAFMNLPVTIMSVRSGFAGYDSHTHHGIYDLSYLKCVPNLPIFYPGTSYELEKIIEERCVASSGPLMILYPYESIREDEDIHQPRDPVLEGAEVMKPGSDGYILSVGNTLGTGIKVCDLLARRNVHFGLVNARWLNPLPKNQLIPLLKSVGYAVTIEENVLDGGYGSSIAELITDNDLRCRLLRCGIEKSFVIPGAKEDLCRDKGIDAESILARIRSHWAELF